LFEDDEEENIKDLDEEKVIDEEEPIEKVTQEPAFVGNGRKGQSSLFDF